MRPPPFIEYFFRSALRGPNTPENRPKQGLEARQVPSPHPRAFVAAQGLTGGNFAGSSECCLLLLILNGKRESYTGVQLSHV